jgi:hypothetical protein
VKHVNTVVVHIEVHEVTQNHRVSGLHPSSDIAKIGKRNVSETGSASVLG